MESMKLRLDFNNMMRDFVGRHKDGEGFTQSDFDAMAQEIAQAAKAITRKRETGGIDWWRLPYEQADIVAEIRDYVRVKKDGIDAFVVLGIGGSALGPMAVQQAINHPHYNELSREQRGGFPKLYVVDNVDPEKLTCLFDIIDVTKCLFNVISKSGSTSETMSQFMIIEQMLEEKLGADGARSRIVCTTDPKSGNLIKIAKDKGYKTFFVPSAVGGRFSELTPVGLLPAAFCGVDIQAMLDGAALMDKLSQKISIFENPAYMFATLNVMSMRRGKPIVVMMPYADSLKFVADWFAQLWAESLGKKLDNDGNVVNVGPTPVKALGATDQHSQVQLYAEGPFDKIVVFIGVDHYKETITIPKTYQDMPSLGFLGGVTHNRLIQVEQAATEYALYVAGKMNMTITLPEVNAYTIGQLLYMFEMATAFAGELMNINAFDQPGVEEGKNATYAMFGRPGYEDKKKELEAAPKKNEEYII